MNTIVGVVPRLSRVDGRVPAIETSSAVRPARARPGAVSRPNPVDVAELSAEGIEAARLASAMEAHRAHLESALELATTERDSRGELVRTLASDPEETETRETALELLRDLQRSKVDALRDVARARGRHYAAGVYRAVSENA